MVFHAYQFGCGIEKQKNRFQICPGTGFNFWRGVKLTALKPLR